MSEIYACIWRSSASEEEFNRRVPALMEWLKNLKQEGRLRGCGGWLDADGGLTLIEANSRSQVEADIEKNPLSELGPTEIFAWEIFYADLVVKNDL